MIDQYPRVTPELDPYESPSKVDATAVETAARARTAELAGFWRRSGASLIDGLILLPGMLVVTVLLTLHRQPVTAELLDLVVGGVYYTIGYARGRTVGGLALGLRLVDEQRGGRPGYGRGFVRYVVPVAIQLLPLALAVILAGPRLAGALRPLVELFVLLDYLWMLWDPRKQTLHDKLAGTLVIRDDRNDSWDGRATA